MSILTALRKLFHVLLNLWLRVLCWKKRHRDDSDSILPIHVNQKKFNVESSYSPSNYSAYPATINSGHSFYRGATTVSNSHATHSQQLLSHNSQSSQDQEDEDFFKDMEPSLNEQRKYFIANSNQGANNSRREAYNKLSVDLSNSFEMNPELENLEDEIAVTSWEDEAASDELQDIDQTLSAARAQERMRRLEEHRRQRMERDMRKAQNHSSKSRSLGSKLG